MHIPCQTPAPVTTSEDGRALFLRGRRPLGGSHPASAAPRRPLLRGGRRAMARAGERLRCWTGTAPSRAGPRRRRRGRGRGRLAVRGGGVLGLGRGFGGGLRGGRLLGLD